MTAPTTAASERRGRGRSLGALSLAALLLSACTSSSAPTDTPSTTGDVASEASAYDALALGEAEAQLRSVSADVEGQLVTLSGLEKALGGPDRATQAYTAMTTAMVGRVTRFRATSGYAGKFGGRARTADTPSLGGMIFAGWMVGQMSAEGVVTATNDLKPGDPPAHDAKVDDRGADKSTLNLDGMLGTATMDWSVETTANGVTGKVRVKVEINPCPDASGTFTAKVSMATSATAAGGAGTSTTTDISITGHVDDDAKLAGYDTTSHTQAPEAGSSGSTAADVTDINSWSGGKVVSANRTYGSTSGATTPKFSQEWAQMGALTEMMFTKSVLQGAQKGWESGRCVTLSPTTSPAKRSGLDPSATVTISAAPRSKIDGGQVGGTVTATLTGQTSVDPAGSKLPADARFTYVAPGEKDKSASVALEARSKRGVARATVDLDTKPGAYDVTGSIPSVPSGTRFTGTICKVDKPFTVSTSGDMVGTASFTPKSETGGTVTFTGKVGNAPLGMSGRGTYTIQAPKDVGTGTLVLQWKITIHIPVVGDQSRTGPATLTLTPKATC